MYPLCVVLSCACLPASRLVFLSLLFEEVEEKPYLHASYCDL